MLGFEWDPVKDRTNQQKHGVSFTEAATVFDDSLALTIADPREYAGEYRFLTSGYTAQQRFVVV